ncbi:Predicted DNA-binding transcriptional regulator YafY, contains an HTH and WYL domains [Devosia sp. YR412]|nr:Predicted DNA-binding transcriptional regulator YafY, contains an HTH and WYL domains [Devosia sp. YR412]
MIRSQRLMELLQLLRAYSQPVSARELGRRLGVSYRTIYRDIETLMETGVDIRGEQGVGYVLEDDGRIPPLRFTEAEEEALFFGLQVAAARCDPMLREAALHAAAKLRASIRTPSSQRRGPQRGKTVFGTVTPTNWTPMMNVVRAAMSAQAKLLVDYRSSEGTFSARTVWPLGLSMSDENLQVIVWCEQADDFRHLRADGLEDVRALQETFPGDRDQLFSEWSIRANMPDTLRSSAYPPDLN